MKPDLELVQVRQDRSFKFWSHGYPYRTVRWHYHPEYELHLVTSTSGNRYIGDHIGAFGVGDLVLVGSNVPHNWISDVASGEIVEERCLILQFTGETISSCINAFPELRFIERLLKDSTRGIKFAQSLSARIEPLMRELISAHETRRIVIFLEIFDFLNQDRERIQLASSNFQLDSSVYSSAAINSALDYVGRNLTQSLSESHLAERSGQSVSAFCRSFRKHTGQNFVQYVNAMRIELACQHLTQADLTITEICYATGFNNVSNFNRQFLLLKGMPPSKFRSLYREGMRQVVAA